MRLACGVGRFGGEAERGFDSGVACGSTGAVEPDSRERASAPIYSSKEELLALASGVADSDVTSTGGSSTVGSLDGAASESTCEVVSGVLLGVLDLLSSATRASTGVETPASTAGTGGGVAGTPKTCLPSSSQVIARMYSCAGNRLCSACRTYLTWASA